MSNDGEPNTPKPVLGRYRWGEGTLAPELQYWLAGGLGITVLLQLRSHFRLPKPRASANGSFFRTTSVVLASTLTADLMAYFHSKSANDRVDSDRDLQTVSGIARQQAREWMKTRDSPHLGPPIPDHDPVGLGQYAPRAGLSYLAWKVRGHFWLDDRAWNHFHRTLAMRNAEKYPDISPADWDICVSHIARGVFLEKVVVPMRGYGQGSYLWVIAGVVGTELLDMQRWVSFPSVAFRGLHVLWRVICYGWLAFEVLPLPSTAVYFRPLTRLQNKTGVAEMLREVYPGSVQGALWHYPVY